MEDVLRSLSKERLAGIVSELASMSTENMRAVVRAARMAGAGKLRSSARALADQEVGALADELQTIAAEFNELGGGPREDEDRAGELCCDLERILKSRPVSSDARADVVETFLPEVVEHNSGLDELRSFLGKTARCRKSGDKRRG